MDVYQITKEELEAILEALLQKPEEPTYYTQEAAKKRVHARRIVRRLLSGAK